ncbi:MAG TPA: serine hydrolase domain-containing protein [Burkholderiales bacterium]|nr:serine hydrolase domain-containing protein [Burkholderiales bacterium]
MKTDRRTFLKTGAALLASVAAQEVHSESRGEGPLKDNADALLGNAAEVGDVPGVIATATNRDGTIYEGAFGQRVLGQDGPMTIDTVVWIASMTKALTGTAAMQLVEQGKLELNTPASRWVPELSDTQVLIGWANDEPVTRPPKRPITLRHLLTHTAGFAYDLWSVDLGRYEKVKGIPGIISCKNAALKTPLLFDPGERWEYGINLDWAGKMVEAVSGQRLGAYLQQNLFDPLGMNSTAFKITPDMRSRLSKIHMRGEDGRFAPTDIEIPQDPEFEMGGGGLYSTAGDYLTFVRMILNRGTGNGNRVLKAETVDLMSRNAMGDLKVRMLRTAAPALTNDAEFFPGMPKNWGLSFMINEERAPTGRSAGSLAWAGLANTYFWIDPHRGVGGVYLTQVLPFADKTALPLFYAFEKSVYQSPS